MQSYKKVTSYGVIAGYVIATGQGFTQAHGAQPLIKAVQDNDILQIEFLASLDHINQLGIHGETPLHWAAFKGKQATVQLLIHNNAQINAQTYRGETPLHWAVARGQDAIVYYLLDCGAHPQLATKNGETPLALARRLVNEEQVYGISPSTTMKDIISRLTKATLL
jgi:ankyrin repeat protein